MKDQDPNKKKQVEEWLDNLQEEAQLLHDTSSILRKRLSPVMRREASDAPPEPPCENETNLVDVAYSIQNSVKIISQAAEIQREIIRLLEV